MNKFVKYAYFIFSQKQLTEYDDAEGVGDSESEAGCFLSSLDEAVEIPDSSSDSELLEHLLGS